jgi:hypothetical protein
MTISKLSEVPQVILRNNHRHLTSAGVRFYRKMDLHLEKLNQFPRGDEFYGKIIEARETSEVVTLKVSPIVGCKRLEETQTFYLRHYNNSSLIDFPLCLKETSFFSDSNIQLVLEKPANVSDQPLNLKPGMLVTSNGNEYDFKRRIRALYDSDSITVYQIFREEIAEQAISLGKFGDKFSSSRMTWIKTSLLWTMARYRSSENSGQAQRILAIRLARDAFETLLKVACLTQPVFGLYYQNENEYQRESSRYKNRVQWDPDRTIDGKRRKEKAIQLGIHPDNHSLYHKGILSIEDITKTAKEIWRSWQEGEDYQFHLPAEITYPTPLDLLKRLEMHQYFVEEDRELINSIYSQISL